MDNLRFMVKSISEKEDESEGMNSDDIKMIDKKNKQIYYLSIALLIIGLIFLVLGLLVIYIYMMFFVSLFLIPIGLYGIVKYKSLYGNNRRYIYYLIIAVSLPILIFTSLFLTSQIIFALKYSLIYLLIVPVVLIFFIPSLICFVFGIYKLICERRTKGS